MEVENFLGEGLTQLLGSVQCTPSVLHLVLAVKINLLMFSISMMIIW